jgi:hypothetical protein
MVASLPAEQQREYADMFKNFPNAPLSLAVYGSINGDVREEFRSFLITSLRELAGKEK